MVALTSPASGSNMSGAATSGGTAQGQSAGGKGGSIPFVRASALHREPVGYDVTTTMAAGLTTLPDVTIPAYGFLRAIVLVVTTSGFTGGTPVFGEDGPFNALQNIILQEPNGAQIANFPSGYDLFLANKYGGYLSSNDPRNVGGNYSVAPATGNFSFVLRIPVEVDLRDALGALPNQNSGALFRVKLNLGGGTGATNATSVFSTAPTTLGSVRVRAYAEEWDQPEASTNGVANQTVPPALNTTQYWSRQDFGLNSGQSNIRLTRMGNYLRNLIFVYRNAAGSRISTTQDANFPDPATIYYDTRPLDTVSRAQWLDQISNRYGYNQNALGGLLTAVTAPLAVDTPGGRDSSVWPYDFCHEFDGGVGFENRDLWLPTYSSTRFEIGGTWGVAGTLTVLTNDVTIAGNVWY